MTSSPGVRVSSSSGNVTLMSSTAIVVCIIFSLTLTTDYTDKADTGHPQPTLGDIIRVLCSPTLGGSPSATRFSPSSICALTLREKKRAVVAVARKLAVLLLSLWKHGTDYEPRSATPTLAPA